MTAPTLCVAKWHDDRMHLR